MVDWREKGKKKSIGIGKEERISNNIEWIN